MKICVCGKDKVAKSVVYLEKLMQDILPEGCVYSYRDIGDFEERLRDPRQVTDIAVLVPADEQELSEFANLRELFDNTRILLVLHECSPKMILKGHTLQPRFMTFADTELAVVGSVLEKMTHSTLEK